MNNKQIQNIGESILESIQYAETVRRCGGKLSKTFMSRMTDLVETFSVLSMESENPALVEESVSYENILKRLIKENTCNILYEGFFNPFDNIFDSEPEQTVIDKDTIDDDNLRIMRVRLWNSDTKNKIMYVNGKMTAGQHFDIGDIIEKCPVKLVRGDSLYSEEIRDFAFPIDIEKGVYAIPFGYALYYRNSKQFGVEPNAVYNFVDDPVSPYISVIASKRIKKGHEIVIESTEEDFGNELVPGKFDYKEGPESFYSVKSFKIV